MLADTYPRGPSRDKPVFTYVMSPTANLNVSWNSGDVYSPEDGYFHLASGSTLLTDNAVNYAYWQNSNPHQILWTTGTRANVTNSINLGTFVCSFGRIIHAGETIAVGDLPLQMDEAHYNVVPSLIVDGLNFASTGTNFNQIIQVGGTEFHNMSEKNTHPAKNLVNYNLTNGSFLITYYHTNSSSWSLSITNQLPIDQYDNGTNLVSCVLSNWYRGVFISAAGSPSMGWVYPQTVFTSYVDCLNADDPQLPPGFDPYVPRCTAYIFQGGDTNLRTSSDSWIDRRFMIRRGTISGGSGGGSSTTPSLFQVLLQGSGTGGILPNGAGDPSTPDQLTSKHYVDSTINKINAGRAYVDQDNGNDGTALLESSILPFKTIQAAINAASLVASDTNRFIVTVDVGTYNENIIMKNYIGVAASDIESTVINGAVTYPTAFTDSTGAELQQITVISSNTPALIIDSGSDSAYTGIRSCYLVSSYYNGQSNKSVVLFERGEIEIYGTTYLNLNITPTNGSGSVRNAQIFEHTTDVGNPGLSQFTSFGSSCHIASSDTNDDISLMYTHDNTDAKAINNLLGTLFNIRLDVVNGIYTNNVKILSHNVAQGRSLSMGTVTRLYMNLTNSCNVFMGYCNSGTTDNVTIVRGNHVRMPSGSTSNIWFGAATGSNDTLRLYDSVYIQNFSDYPYPRVYTNAGTLGKFFINTVSENGDHLFGSAMDLTIENSGAVTKPALGHLKMYAGTYAGLENPYFKDSSGNVVRMARDSFYNGFNADTTAMKVGDVVYISSGLSPDNTPKVKKSIASDPSTMPCIGMVSQLGGIATGAVGRIMLMGRLENFVDTSAFVSGQKLYVSDTVLGGITNVLPASTNISQLIGTCHISSTNGYVNVRIWGPDTLGGLVSQTYVTNNQSSVTFGSVVADGTSVSNVDAKTVGGFTADQLLTVSATYYLSTNTTSYGAITGRMATLTIPTAMQVSTYSGPVTNGQVFADYMISSNEMPSVLEPGIYSFIFYGNHVTGAANHPTIMGHLKVLTASNGVEVQNFPSAPVEIPYVVDYFQINLAVTNSIVKDGYVFVLETMLVDADGYTGDFTSYFGKPFYPHFNIPTAPGIFVTYADWNTDKTNRANLGYQNNFFGATNTFATIVASNLIITTGTITGDGSGIINIGSTNIVGLYTSNWDTAYAWVNGNSNGVAYVLSRTNAWDATTALQQANSNGVAYVLGRTSSWDTAYSWVNANSNNIVSSTNKVWDIAGNTNNYQTAYSWVNGNSNAVQNGTGNWNIAYSWVNANSNKDSYVWSRTNTWDSTTSIVNAMPTGNWNTAYSWVNGNSNGVAYLVSRSNVWDTAYNWVNSNSNAIQNGTGNWNIAYTWVNANSNNIVSSTNKVWDVAGNTNNYQYAYNHATTIPSRVKAGLGTNVTFASGVLVKFPMTNVLYTSGVGIYSNSLSRWYPNTTNKVLEFMGGVDFLTVQANNITTLYLFKNGTNHTTLGAFRSPNNAAPYTVTWNYIDTLNTSTQDYYEIFVTNSANAVTTDGVHSNNWWFGRAE